MRTVNVDELLDIIPRLKEILAVEHEMLLVSNGEPIARVASVEKRRTPFPSLKTFRDEQPMLGTPIEVLIREERDRR